MASTDKLLAAVLPFGVKILPLHRNFDARGDLTEIFRNSWIPDPAPVQWNLLRSRAHAMRGMKVHLRHHDYQIVVQGKESVGLKDLRQDSPTHDLSTLLTLDASESLVAVTIPLGVAHGFYSHSDSMHLAGVSHYYDIEDELGCHYADPDLGIQWPSQTFVLSENDKHAQSLSALRAQITARLSPSAPRIR